MMAISAITEGVFGATTYRRTPELSDKQRLHLQLQANPQHPIHFLKSVCDTARVNLRKLSNVALEQVVHTEFAKMNDAERDSTEFPSSRSRMLEFMHVRVEQEFKRQWKERMGWEFDIVYRPAEYNRLLLSRYAQPTAN